MSSAWFEIACPRCGGVAEFDEPYEWYPKKKGPPDTEKRRQFHFGGSIVLEKYPTVFPWKPPVIRPYLRLPEDYTRSPWRFHRSGVSKCRVCKVITRHLLRWPRDAYYRWTIRGANLWAWNRSHALALLEYVRAKLRRPEDFPAYRSSLEKLPGVILDSKSREQIIRRISGSLNSSSSSAKRKKRSSTAR